MAEIVFIEKFLMRLAAGMFIALVTLILVGEKRVDVYIAAVSYTHLTLPTNREV